MEVTLRTVDYYYRANGRSPFKDWLNVIRDKPTEQIIDSRIARLRRGLLGDCRYVGQGVWELRIDVGPGYRVYFGQKGQTWILLLCGGHKGSQVKDIRTAQEYWADYQ